MNNESVTSRITSFILSIAFIFLLSSFVITQEYQPKLRPIQKDGKWGYIDKSGKVAIAPQFYWVEEFSEGLASFETEDGKHGYIDETGKIVIEPIFSRAEPFSEGLAPVAINFEWGFIDKNGKILIPLQFQYAHRFKDGIAPVSLFLKEENARENIFGINAFIDKSGKMILPPFKSLFNPRTSQGFLFIEVAYPVGESPKPEIVDKTGKRLIQVEEFNIDGFREGVTPVQVDKKWGYIDTTGKFVIQPQFADAKSFSEGLAAVKIREKWGYINHQGKLVIPAKYGINEVEDENHAFSEGLALVYFKNQYLFINQKGQKVLSLSYSKVERFIGGIAAVRVDERRDEKRGYIDKKGTFVWGPTKFQYIDLTAKIEKSRKEAEKEENESLSALTDEEKNLNYRDLVANQPDFSADLSFFRSEAVSGGGGGERITRIGNRYRKESPFWIFLGETGKPRIRLFPEEKIYDDLEPAESETLSYSSPFNPKTMASDIKTTFTPVGKITIEGRECVKVQVQRSRENRDKEKIFLYLAKDLKYLSIVAQVQNPPYSFVQRLENISLDVAESLVQIPPDYKPIERDTWKKVENAIVKYRGKIAKESGVFRSPTGELFVWVDTGDSNNPFMWRYLVRPNEKTADTAFQGMLVTRNGEYVWRAKEKEAFSHTGYRSIEAIEDAKSRGKPVQVTPKSIKFLDINWIEIIFL